MDTTMAFALNSRDRWMAGCNERDQIIRQLYAQISGLKHDIEALKSDLKETKVSLSIEQMDAAALRASNKFVKELGSKFAFAYQPSGKVFKDGSPKSNMALVYEAVFDKMGHDLGLANPAAYRVE